MRPQKDYFKKILVIRTDRLGDVVLTTPALKALRESCPQSHIAIMVSPHTRELLEDNPYIDEVIVYDKDKKDRGAIGFLKFVLSLKKKRFDLAIILHTKRRVELISFLADIPKRIGYGNRKFGFLLTDRIPDTRHLGLKHEIDYCLDILRKLNLKTKESKPYIAVKKESLEWIDEFLKTQNISGHDKIAGLHPGASCPSKRWLKERFVILANRLVEDYGFKILIIAQGPENVAIADELAKNIRYPVINLAGELTLSRLAAALKRCAILISNDSGPVHIASAVGTPVISIFGRNQAGLSPLRWGPVGRQDKYLHKEVGCSVCLAHKCEISFDCLKAITVEDVLKSVDDVLKV